MVDGVGALYHLRVGCHETVHIGPYLQTLGIQGGGYDGGGVVAAAAAQVGDVARGAVAADETGHQRYLRQAGKGLAHQGIGGLAVEHMLAVLALGLDEVAGVEPLRVVHQGGHDAAAQTLTIAHDGVESLAAQVVYQVHTEENALQLVEKGVYLAEQGGALAGIAYHGAYHVVVARLHLPEGHGIALVALAGHFRGGY